MLAICRRAKRSGGRTRAGTFVTHRFCLTLARSPGWFTGQASSHCRATLPSFQSSLSAPRLCIQETVALNPVSPSIGSNELGQKVKTSACPVNQHSLHCALSALWPRKTPLYPRPLFLPSPSSIFLHTFSSLMNI